MKAYIASWGEKIAPFSKYARDCLIGNVPLRQLQIETLKAAGLEPIFMQNLTQSELAGNCYGEDEHILLSDDMYFSIELIKEFIVRSRQLKATTVCAVKKGGFTSRSGINLLQLVAIKQDYVEYKLFYYPKNGDSEVKSRVTQTVVIDSDEFNATIPMPPHMCPDGHYHVPVADKFIVQINHWVNLWMANITSSLYFGARVKKSSKLNQLWLALKAQSFNQWNVLGKSNKIGKNCDIHHTAYIEGSTIGDNVTVGAGAVIRHSTIGDGVSIGNNVTIEESVIGGDCVIMVGHVVFSVMYPHTFSVTGMVTASMIGPDCFLGANSILTDFRLDNLNVMVVKDGQLVDSGHTFLGSCLGRGVYIGAGCVVAPGREVPAGTRLAAAEDRIVRSFRDSNDIPGYRVIKPVIK